MSAGRLRPVLFGDLEASFDRGLLSPPEFFRSCEERAGLPRTGRRRLDLGLAGHLSADSGRDRRAGARSPRSPAGPRVEHERAPLGRRSPGLRSRRVLRHRRPLLPRRRRQARGASSGRPPSKPRSARPVSAFTPTTVRSSWTQHPPGGSRASSSATPARSPRAWTTGACSKPAAREGNSRTFRPFDYPDHGEPSHADVPSLSPPSSSRFCRSRPVPVPKEGQTRRARPDRASPSPPAASTRRSLAPGARKQLVLVDVYTDWCGWCKKLDQEVFADARVAEAARDLVAIRVDAEKGGEKVAERYSVEGFPTILFVDGSGNVVKRVDGYVDAAEMLRILSALPKG